ncbi:thioesterase family protein [Paenibacillus sp. YPG26]|uniref:acyl-CoA thioesterase n=1 Tax=Paenibacillus sp. YPG26 TaxID=2878915 RepID=UPI00203D7DDF|nr:thioesterase family protein [Paenibacillus sp. YPG26]USB32381.1 acyl-CoA thioesterase [Paenibacillus sp. YPG26]
MGTQHRGADKSSRWFKAELRVRYQETDQMSVVYHSNYLGWFEIGRTEMIRQLGYDYRAIEQEGVLLPVIDANLQFKLPAHYDDQISVFTRVTSFSPLRLGYAYEIRRFRNAGNGSGEIIGDSDQLPGELLVTGSTSHVWVDLDWKPVRLDKKLPNLYNALDSILTRA